jgi:hypothetical protein
LNDSRNESEWKILVILGKKKEMNMMNYSLSLIAKMVIFEVENHPKFLKSNKKEI